MQATLFNNAKLALPFAVLLGFLAGCDAQGQTQGQNSTATPPPPQVEVAEVRSEQVTLWGAFNGRIEAPQTVELRPRVNGYIDQVAFEEGELVSEGDVLFVIDPRPYESRKQLAQAELERMRSQLALASSEAARAAELWERRAVSREEFDQRNAAEIMAQAAVNAAEAALQSAQLDLEYTRIKAPISGRIGRAEITRGNLASADDTLLATLVSVEEMPVAAASAALLVDQKAVLTDQDRRYLYILGDDNRVARRVVETGHRVDGLLVITEGLTAGERVVVNGLQKISFPGIEVTPETVDMRTPEVVAIATAP